MLWRRHQGDTFGTTRRLRGVRIREVLGSPCSGEDTSEGTTGKTHGEDWKMCEGNPEGSVT